MLRLLICLLFVVGISPHIYAQELYSTLKGEVYFKSDAPLELIEARSTELQGIIDADKLTFAFAVRMQSFQGFNSPLQREHFNENYLESKSFPRSTFVGKIIENVDFSKNGEFTIRAKGTFTIHGIEQERIIKSNVVVKDGVLSINSEFTVLLEEHDIDIPRIVNQKISEEIYVKIEAEFSRKKV